jgi:hypothetical protein
MRTCLISYKKLASVRDHVWEEGANLVLVPVHTRQGPDMSEDILDRIGKLERIDIAESILHVGIDHQLGESEDFTAQMERVSET